jgi:hypothetical protein
MDQTFFIQLVDGCAGLIARQPFEILSIIREITDDPRGIDSESVTVADFSMSCGQAATGARYPHDRCDLIQQEIHILDRNNLPKVTFFLPGGYDPANDGWDEWKCLDLIQHGEGIGSPPFKILEKCPDMFYSTCLREQLLAIVPHGQIPGFAFAVLGTELTHTHLFAMNFPSKKIRRGRIWVSGEAAAHPNSPTILGWVLSVQ